MVERKELKKWAEACRGQHKGRGFYVNISVDALVDMAEKAIGQPCYYCGNIVKSGKWKYNPARFTLDIIEPENKEMNEDNCRIICYSCNQAKGHLNEFDFIRRCRDILTRCEGVYI